MLNQLHSKITGFGAKLLLALLVMSFALWGVADMLNTPTRNRAVATVGGVPISVEAYQRALQREIDTLRRTLGDNASPEAINALHPEQQALQSLITQQLLGMENESLGLIPGDADLVRRIRNNPAFHDAQGNFDKSRLEAALRNARVPEKTYLDKLRRDIAAELLVGTIVSAAPLSDIAVETLHKVRGEQRAVTIYTLDDDRVGKLPAPEAGALETYFSQHEREFSAPEYRTVSYVVLKPEAAKANTKIPEETLLAAYQERIDEFKRPERRNVDQLLFSNQADADKAYTDLQSGTSFDEVAKNAPIMNKGATSLGKIEREHIIEDAAETVFTATKKSVTKPVRSPFGWHIFHVRDIDPPSAAPLSEVRAILEKEIKQQVLDDAFNKLLNQLEDALAGGTPLQEAAKEFGIAVSTIGPITREGKTPDGSTAKLPQLDRFLEVAFKTEDKMESPLINSNGGVYYIVRVDTLQPQRQRSLDEVRGLVTTAWQKEERARRLQQMASEMAAKMADKAARADAINHYSLNTLYAGRLKRTQTQAGETPLPPVMISDIFAQPAGASTEAYPLSSSQYAIAVAGERIPAGPMKPEDAREIREELEANLKREIGGEYLAYLERKYPVTINDALIQSLRDQQ